MQIYIPSETYTGKPIAYFEDGEKEDLPGKYIRFEDNGFGSTVTKIGNIVNDKWFDMKNFFSCDS